MYAYWQGRARCGSVPPVVSPPTAASSPARSAAGDCPLNLGFTELTWRKIGLVLLIPVLVYLAMTALLR